MCGLGAIILLFFLLHVCNFPPVVSQVWVVNKVIIKNFKSITFLC